MRVATTAGKVNATEKVDGVKAKLKLTPGKVEDEDRWMQFYVRRSIQNRSLMLIHTQQRYSLEEYEKFEFDPHKLWLGSIGSRSMDSSSRSAASPLQEREILQ